ncbi:MAG TPA: ABC transporter permease, partial [Gemmatimonadaceae bacterium]
MSDSPRWRRYFRFFGPNVEADVDDELAFHMEMRIRDYESTGMSRAEAERAARERFGDYPTISAHLTAHDTDIVRTQQRRDLMEDLLQDIRYALRNLRRAPGFALVAIATLALGIGANTAIFSVVDAVVVRPLPYPHPEQLVGMRMMTLAEVTRIAELNRSFARVGAYMQTSVGISGVGESERVDAASTTVSIFPTLGTSPAIGRWFNDDEATNGRSHVVILSNALWQQRFGADRGAIGTSIMIEGAPYTIVGVMPAEFHFPTKETQLWTPVTQPVSRTSGMFWGSGGYSVIARLRPQITAGQARQEVKALFGQIRVENPIWTPAAKEYLNEKNTNVAPLQSKIVGSARTMLLLLLGVVSVVLLIACANVANLLLVRATSRQREMAIRAAIGGSRIRLVRQALTESVVLAILGGLCGVAVAWGGVEGLTALLPADTPRIGEIALNARVLFFTGGLAL